MLARHGSPALLIGANGIASSWIKADMHPALAFWTPELLLRRLGPDAGSWFGWLTAVSINQGSVHETGYHSLGAAREGVVYLAQ
jgi:hypothetical protein